MWKFVLAGEGNRRIVRRAAVAFLALAVMILPLSPAVEACCEDFQPFSCYRTANMTMMNAFTVLAKPGFVVIVYQVTVTVDSGTTPGIRCGQPFGPFGACTTEPMVSQIDVELTLDCGPGSGGPYLGTAMVTPPVLESGLKFYDIDVPIVFDFPVGYTGSKCDVSGTASVDFMADPPLGNETVVASADSVVCAVEESADHPGLPRLELKLANTEPPRCGSGFQRGLNVIVQNNDESEGVSLVLKGRNKQNAVTPMGTAGNPPPPGTSSISNPDGGDDFILCWQDTLPANGIAPLPPDPISFQQPEIARQVNLGPGEMQTFVATNVSHPMCSDGSCVLVEFEAEGTFDTVPSPTAVLACMGGSLNLQRGSDCPNADFVAACCLDGGACMDMKPADCINAEGVPGEAYSNCQNTDVVGGENDPPPNGIDDACEVDLEDRVFTTRGCCFQFGGCEDLEPMECVHQGGTPSLPAENTCATASCPTDFGQCCTVENQSVNCNILLQRVCESVSNGEYAPSMIFDDGETLTWGTAPGACSAAATNEGEICFNDGECPPGNPGNCSPSGLAESFNIYRGDLATIKSGGGYGNCLGTTANNPVQLSPTFASSPTPNQGEVFTYLIGFRAPTATEDTGLGRASDTTQRTVNECP